MVTWSVPKNLLHSWTVSSRYISTLYKVCAVQAEGVQYRLNTPEIQAESVQYRLSTPEIQAERVQYRLSTPEIQAKGVQYSLRHTRSTG